MDLGRFPAEQVSQEDRIAERAGKHEAEQERHGQGAPGTVRRGHQQPHELDEQKGEDREEHPRSQ